MDDDPVLFSLGADLEQSDPALAAFLSGRAPSRRRHSAVWLLLAVPLLIPALILPMRVSLGVLAISLILASPVLVCWLCADPEGPATGRS
jgi:hypothetical protein